MVLLGKPQGISGLGVPLYFFQTWNVNPSEVRCRRKEQTVIVPFQILDLID